ncbi:hypothetical protein ESCO_002026 [Escovopsis weberi]|uniref:Uncharacterized protein n=1 Tax=Escovopsis weberi TaxID=150374 RepID=A0A0M9VWR0_ESCWE|nr:hypothetical protein ESCO_002026 [Escovopsis weberi]
MPDGTARGRRGKPLPAEAASKPEMDTELNPAKKRGRPARAAAEVVTERQSKRRRTGDVPVDAAAPSAKEPAKASKPVAREISLPTRGRPRQHAESSNPVPAAAAKKAPAPSAPVPGAAAIGRGRGPAEAGAKPRQVQSTTELKKPRGRGSAPQGALAKAARPTGIAKPAPARGGKGI